MEMDGIGKATVLESLVIVVWKQVCVCAFVSFWIFSHLPNASWSTLPPSKGGL